MKTYEMQLHDVRLASIRFLMAALIRFLMAASAVHSGSQSVGLASFARDSRAAGAARTATIPTRNLDASARTSLHLHGSQSVGLASSAGISLQLHGSQSAGLASFASKRSEAAHSACLADARAKTKTSRFVG